MAVKRLIDHLHEDNIQELAIIGMAKNAGKTVTFNKLVEEAQTYNMKLALVSYGRDGEELDAITRQKKPRIYIPSGAIFATASKVYEKSDIKAKTLSRTGILTLLGEIRLYENRGQGGEVELVGLNSSSKLDKIKSLLPDNIDLLIVDGALDRRSSAVPELTQGFILATGAVVANTIEGVVSRTRRAIELLTLPEINNAALPGEVKELFASSRNGIITDDDQLIPLGSTVTLASIDELARYQKDHKIKALLLKGALTDRFAEKLIYSLRVEGLQIIVQDGTRVFLNHRNINLFKKRNINLQVMNSLKPVAVTVNPTSPYGVKLDSSSLVHQLRNELGSIPVYNLMSKDYQTISRGD